MKKSRKRKIKVIRPVIDDPEKMEKKIEDLVDKSSFGLGTYGITSDGENEPAEAVEGNEESTGAEELRKPLSGHTEPGQSSAISPEIKRKK